MQGPDRVTQVDPIPEGERKSTTLCDGGSDSGFKEIHVDETDESLMWQLGLLLMSSRVSGTCCQ